MNDPASQLPFDDHDREDFANLAARAYAQLSPMEIQGLLADAKAMANGELSIDISARLPEIDMGEWEGQEPPPRVSLWGDQLLPTRQTTLLTGKGGIGKSLFAQCLVTSTAIGASFLGQPTIASRCLYITCEDDADELWRRQVAICKAYGISLEQLQGKLQLVSLAGEAGTSLASFDRAEDGMTTTARWEQLRGSVYAGGARLVVFDNATDAMDGDLNDLHQVAEFVNMTTGLAIGNDGSFLLLHHPNKAGDDWLGSVAWHNKVRSRLIIEGGAETDPDARKVRNPKANYGPQGGEIAFRWHKGAFVADSDLPADEWESIAVSARAASDNQIFLNCLRALTQQERQVSPSMSITYAPAIMVDMPESKGLHKKRLTAAMNRLLATKTIEKGELPWKKADRHPAVGLRETAVNGAGNARSTVRGTRGQHAGNPAVNAAETHPSPKGEEGAAPSGPAAPSHSDPFDDDPFDPKGWDS